MQIPIHKNLMEKPKKRYKLYCPISFNDHSGKGYNTFYIEYLKSDGNVIEHLIKYGSMMEWYQIVDTRNDMKVVREQSPE